MSSTDTTDILLEAGTNELEIVEFYLEEEPKEDDTVELNEKDGEEKEGRKKSRKGYYGVNVAKVLEIIRMPKITEMPEVSHESVLGAFNLRSRIIPLLDLSKWLKKKRVENEPPKAIVTEFNQVTSAFMVSGVTRIHRISWEDVEAPNKYVSALSSDPSPESSSLMTASSSSWTWNASFPNSTRICASNLTTMPNSARKPATKLSSQTTPPLSGK